MIQITAISNREEQICYKIKKSSEFYAFLFDLLKEFNEKLPDIQDEKGNSPDIFKEVDTYSFQKGESIGITQVTGKEHVFLIIKTKQREKLNEFIKNNTYIA